MEWHQFLRAERARKLDTIDRLSSGTAVISVRYDDVLRDASAQMIADTLEHITEIEEILTAAGEPF